MPNNVLIVDDESSLLLSLEAGFAALRDKITLFTAKNGKAAVQILESTAVDLVVTDIRMPEMGGFELLAYLSSRFPGIPVIVMSAYATPDMESQFEATGPLRILEKPIDFNELVHAVQEGLAYAAQQGSISGISVDSFLQLIEMEEKTCLLEVSNPNRQKGLFYFYEGRLYDALCGSLKGRTAAVEMVTWEDVRLNFKNLPGKRIQQRITTGLMSILMAASKIKDDARGADGTEVVAVIDGQTGITEAVLQRDDNRIEKDSDDTGPISGMMADLVRQAADRADDILIIAMADGTGRCTAWHSPANLDPWVFAAQIVHIMDILVDPVDELNRGNRVRDAILRTDQSWVVCRRLGADVYLGIMAGKGSTLERIRRFLNGTAGKLAGTLNGSPGQPRDTPINEIV